MYDSVFSRLTDSFDKFSSDKFPSSEQTIGKELTEIEKPAQSLFEQTFKTHLDRAIDKLSKAINEGDRETIKKYKWGLNIELGNNLWGEWLLGWETGIKRGNKEIRRQQATEKKQELALFKMPEAETAVIRNTAAEEAVRQRVNTLAKDVSDDQWKQIKAAILDAIKPISETEPPISRKQLYARINEALGDRANRFKNRAEMIARTELTAAYNAGRLDSYVKSGLVEAVKYRTIFDDRRCPICASRQGLIVPLTDIESIAKITPPIHPRCRCVLSPVLKTEYEKEGKKKERQIKERNVITQAAPWAIAALLAAVLLGAKQAAAAKEIVKVPTKAIEAATQKIAAAQAVTEEEKAEAERVLAEEKAIAEEVISEQDLNDIVEEIAQQIEEQAKEKIIVKRKLNSIIKAFLNKKAKLKIDEKVRQSVEQKIEKKVKQKIDENLQQKIQQKIREKQEQNLLAKIKKKLLEETKNKTALDFWVKAGGTLTKDEALAVQELLNKQTFNTMTELEKALLQQKLNQAQVDKIKNMLVERVTLGTPTSITPAPATTRRRLLQARQLTDLAESQQNLVLDSIGKQLDNALERADRLKVTVTNDIQSYRGTETQIVEQSVNAVSVSETIADDLIAEIAPNNAQVDVLNTRINDLENKLAALLDPNVEDYFFARERIVTEVRNEIQAIRGQVNNTNRFANANISQARATHRQLIASGKTISQALPDYSDRLFVLNREVQAAISRLVMQSQVSGSLPTSSAIKLSQLRAQYRQLQAEIREINNLIANPIADRLQDKNVISANMRRAKRASSNLSNRLSNLESRLERLPSYINQLAPSRRAEYRKLRRSITLPDYVVPAEPTPGVRGREARLAKASRLQRQAQIDAEIAAIKARANEIRDAADEVVSQTTYKGRDLNYWNKRNDRVIDKVYFDESRVKADTSTAVRKAISNVELFDSEINILADKIRADINDPLSENWFANNGSLLRSSSERLQTVRKSIQQELNDIDSEQKLFSRLSEVIAKERKTLEKVRDRALNFRLNPGEKARLDRQIDRLTTELSSLNRFEVTSNYYSGIAKYLEQLEAIKSGTSEQISSSLLKNLDISRDILLELQQSMAVANNIELFTDLEQAKQRLAQLRRRLGQLPKRVSTLSPENQINWQAARRIKRSTNQATASLQRSLDKYRQDRNKLNSQLNSYRSQTELSLAEIESGAYAQSLERSIKSQQDKVAVAITELDENLQIMRLATDTERGLSLIYDDLKQIYSQQIPGLDRVKVDIGLDEAVEVKRKIIKAISDKGDRLTKRIEKIIQTDSAKANTRYKLANIEDKITKLRTLRDRVRSQKTQVDRIKDDLNRLRQTNPIAHQEINPLSIVGEVNRDIVDFQTAIEKQLTRLDRAKKTLTADLDLALKYDVRPKKTIELRDNIPIESLRPSQSLTKENLLAEVRDYRAEVKGLKGTRRAVLEQVGLKLKARRIKLIGDNSITDNLKKGNPLTEGQQRAFNSLNAEQKQLLIDASTTGVMDLYDDLYRLSVTRGTLELDDIAEANNIFSSLGLTDSRRVTRASLKTRKWQEISGHLNNLRNMGYQDLRIELSAESAKLLNVPDLPPRASGSRFARYQLRQLLTKLGVDENGNPLTVSDLKIQNLATGAIALDNPSLYNYQELLKAIAQNRQLRYEANNRLDAFSFNRQLYIAQFKLNLRNTSLLQH